MIIIYDLLLFMETSSELGIMLGAILTGAPTLTRGYNVK